MKKTILIILIALGFGCNRKSEESTTEISSSSSNYTLDSIPSQEIEGNPGDTSRKFIRTADLRFKVKNVRKATTEIERIVSRYHGFVTQTHLNSNILSSITTPMSSDSVLVTTKYEVANNIALRIPNTSLDTTLERIATLVEYLDYRTIKAEDVALQILANRLTQKRIGKYEEISMNVIEKHGKKLDETTEAEDNLFYKIEQRDNALVDNLNLKDKVDFSTVNLIIYQKETINQEVLPNTDTLDNLKSPWRYRFLDALQTGVNILAELILLLIRMWPVIILTISGYFLYKYFKNKSVTVRS